MNKFLHSIFTLSILFIGCKQVNAQCANIVYTTEYNCTTGDVDMDVTSVDISEIPYSVTIGGVTQSVSSIGLYSFSGVSTDITVPTEITTIAQCSDEGEFTATGCSSIDCSTPSNLIIGGGFEGADWVEVSTADGVATGIMPIGNTWPLLGNNSAWLGGWADTSITSVSQDIIISNGLTATLSFWFYVGACDSPDDYLTVSVDDNPELTLTSVGAYCGDGNWHKIVYDLSAYADGNTHTLKLQGNTFGTNNTGSNFFIDELMLETCPVVLGLEDSEKIEMNVSIQPNPAINMSILSVNMDVATEISVQIVDLTGKVISDVTIPKTKSVDYPLDTEYLRSGSYIVRVSGVNQTILEKLMIIK